MTTRKKKFYAVAKGRKPGIYETWFGANGARAQVDGFAGAVFKGFETLKEAREFLENPPEPYRRAERRKKTPCAEKPTDAAAPGADDGRVIMYTDGGALNNPGPGGYGVVLVDGADRRELSGGFRYTTNNRMELMACISGLKALEKPSAVTLYSDSKYVVDGITKGWAIRWRKNGWMRTKTESAVNPDLWGELLALCEQHDVEFIWVKGHARNPGNERCDQLANQMAAGRNLPPDVVYEKGLR